MFYNAMKRKGHGPQEDEMVHVVNLHNAVNEQSWANVMKWEQALHSETAEGVRLTKFAGDAKNFTVKALIKHKLFGQELPFDRQVPHIQAPSYINPHHTWDVLAKAPSLLCVGLHAIRGCLGCLGC
jgi:hypothetical protein